MATTGSALTVWRDDEPVAVDYVRTGEFSRPKRVVKLSARRAELIRRRHLLWYLMVDRLGFGVMEIAALFGYTHGVVSRGVKVGERIARESADGC